MIKTIFYAFVTYVLFWVLSAYSTFWFIVLVASHDKKEILISTGIELCLVLSVLFTGFKVIRTWRK